MPDHVRSKIRRLRWRVRGERSLQWSTLFLFWALVAACGLVLTDRLFSVGIHLLPAIAWLLGGSTLVGLIAGALRPVTPMQAALLADEQLRLRERLSSALALAAMEDPMVRALRDDAEKHASRIRVCEAVPFSLPPRAAHLPIAGVVLVVLGLFFPQLDLLALGSQRDVSRVAKEEIEQQATRLEQIEKTVAAAEEVRAVTAAARLADEIKKISEELKKERLSRTEALAKVSNLSDKLDEKRKKLLEDLDTSRRTYSPQKFGKLQDLAKSLSDQEFEKAADSLKKLAQELEAGELSESERASSAADLEQMAALLSQNPSLSLALAEMARGLKAEDVGAMKLALDEALASLADLEDLLEQLALLDAALQNVNLSKLALAGQISSCSACRSCGKCPGCGGSGKCPGCGGSGKDGQGGSCSLCGGSGQCPFCQGSGMCSGCGGCGFCQGSGSGTGIGMGYGQGLGPRPTDDSVLTSLQDERIAGQLRPGKILAAIRVRGEQVRGESGVEIVDAFRELRQNSEQALSKENIPITMKNRVKAYFDAIDPHTAAPYAEGDEVGRESDAHP